MVGDALSGSVGSVGGPEGVVNEEIKGGSQLSRELGIVLGLLRVEAGVLEEEDGLGVWGFGVVCLEV